MLRLPARVLSQVGRFYTGVDIHPGALLGRSAFHRSRHRRGDRRNGHRGQRRDHVPGRHAGRHRQRHTASAIPPSATVSSSATTPMFWAIITVGENSRVGAGSVVLTDVPPNSTVVGVPAHIVYRNGERVLITDPHDIKDPLSDALIALSARVEEAGRAARRGTVPARSLCRRGGRAQRLSRGTGTDAGLCHHGRRHLKAVAAHCTRRARPPILSTGDAKNCRALRTFFLRHFRATRIPLNLHGLITLVHRICLEEPTASAAENTADAVWNRHGRGAFVGLVGFSRSSNSSGCGSTPAAAPTLR